LSETITERIRKFREDRISKILADETPIPLLKNPKIILHLLPIISFNPAQNYDIKKISSDPDKMSPIDSRGYEHRYNLDGFLTYYGSDGGQSHSYVQLFKNGIIEAVNASLFATQKGKKLIPSIAYEKALITSSHKYLINVLKTLNVEPPIFMFLTLLGVKGYSMSIDPNRSYRYGVHEIDRDVVLLPEVIIESYDVQAEDVLRPCFDSVWNACGFPGSFNYDNTGK
jgi:hypothetical protein